MRYFAGFTLIELMVVIAVILVLAGLVLSISGYAMDKGARSRAETEIAAMSAAMESYKADNGIYPRDAGTTDMLNAKADFDASATKYQNASFYLFTQLSGLNASQQPISGMRSYFTFKPQTLGHVPSTSTNVAYIRDPWGNSYGYSTANQANSSNGYNPTFDLWSTTNDKTGATVKWIKNW